jgi:Peptidase M15
MTMALSAHFTLEELTTTTCSYDNTPSADTIQNLVWLSEHLEIIRRLCGGKPIKVISGYRSPAVNQWARGVTTSAHCYGRAVDFVIEGMTPTEICALLAETTDYDQLIDEQRGADTWVHYGISLTPRHEYLKFRNGIYTKVTP